MTSREWIDRFGKSRRPDWLRHAPRPPMASTASPAPARDGAKTRLLHLDALRGLAALGVVVGHARSFTLVPYADAQDHSLAVKVLYGIGSLGHVCVIVFFALSGFLVGGSALSAMTSGRFTWRDYAAARLSRLWTVLVPALLLTALLDATGALLAPPGAYAGSFHAIVASGPSPAAPASYSAATLVGNLFFLQTILVPVYGSNGPLWSLANEAWYYIAFPLVAYGFLAAGNRLGGVVSITAGAAILLLLPFPVVVLGIPWVAGAFAALLPPQARPLRAALSSGFIAAALAYALATRTLAADAVLGCAVALALPGLAVLPAVEGVYARAAKVLSEISFTLYAVHFPLMALLWFSFMAPLQHQAGAAAVAQMALLIVSALLYATLVWMCFERRTARVRALCERLLAMSRRDGRPEAVQ